MASSRNASPFRGTRHRGLIRYRIGKKLGVSRHGVVKTWGHSSCYLSAAEHHGRSGFISYLLLMIVVGDKAAR